MFAEVGLALPDEPTCVVPKSAVVEKEGHARLYVVEDGRAVLRVVALGARDDVRVGVLRGVKKGEHVVVSPPADLANGAYVDL